MPNSESATDLVRDLIAAGVEPSLIARVSILAARVSDLDRRRSTDAARQQRNRLRHATSRDTEDVTPRIDTTPPSSSKPKGVSRSARATTLPDDWSLDEKGRAYARQKKGWPESRIEEEAERFQNNARAKGRKQASWPAAWQNWVTSPYQNQEAKNGHGGNGKTNLSALAHDLADEMRGREREAGVVRSPTPIRGD